jgi:hypothetical protein
MSNALTFKSPQPFQTFQVNAATNLVTDANGLCTAEEGSDLARRLIALGWTIVAPLPTSDPKVGGAIWNNGGTLAISAG